MAEDEGEVRRPRTVEVAQVGMADGACSDFDANLVGARRGKLEILDARWDARTVAHCRTDDDPSARWHGAESTPDFGCPGNRSLKKKFGCSLELFSRTGCHVEHRHRAVFKGGQTITDSGCGTDERDLVGKLVGYRGNGFVPPTLKEEFLNL